MEDAEIIPGFEMDIPPDEHLISIKLPGGWRVEVETGGVKIEIRGAKEPGDWLDQPLYDGQTRREVYIGWLESLRRWVPKTDRIWDQLPDYDADTAEDELRAMCAFLVELLKESEAQRE